MSVESRSGKVWFLAGVNDAPGNLPEPDVAVLAGHPQQFEGDRRREPVTLHHDPGGLPDDLVALHRVAQLHLAPGGGAGDGQALQRDMIPPVAFGLMLSGLIPRETIAVVPIVGILIGGSMTATTLAGKRALDALRTRHGEYEAALSIGLMPRDSALLVARADAALALVPGLDQTRTVGLVTLPGAFVGMLLGGASPLQAAAVQLVVLVALLLVQAIAVLITVQLVAAGYFSPPVTE